MRGCRSLVCQADMCVEHQCAESTGKQQDKLRGPCHWGTVTEATVVDPQLALQALCPAPS